MKPSDPPVIVEKFVEVPIEKLWNSVTDLAQMQEWFFGELTEFRPEIGFTTGFTVDHAGKSYIHQWKLTEVTAPSRMVIDWQYKDCDGRGLVEWDLASLEAGSTITVTNSIIEEFPRDDPAFARESCEEGWKYLMDRLKSHVE